MTGIEFQRRQEIINRAMKLYGKQTNYNINLALELLAEPDFEILVPAESMKGLTGSVLDDLPRPLCPECNSPMYIRSVPENPDNINTQLVCQSNSCDLVLDSDLTFMQWVEILTEQFNPNGPK